MPRPSRIRRLTLVAVLIMPAVLLTAGRGEPPTRTRPAAIDFNRDIRPILSENCFACHGPDEKQRKAKLRLDTKAGAFHDLRDGGRAIVPGKVDESELIERVTMADRSKLMPPVKSGKSLKSEQIAMLKLWVEQGAKWTEHWAFVAPERPAMPSVSDAAWARNTIDKYILARLDAERLRPSPEAEPAKVIRRVTLDLTGLPPTPAEVDAFLSDLSPGAYERAVDRLLSSPRYGEHMARFWLDAARYGDTHGLHLDNYREIWPYRDWVIRAFNDNLPYDRFVVEQLAGDLLPNATLDQVIATGYNRCHVTTSEGGSIEEEVYVRNVVDQVDTNGSVFLGLSVGCARCHDHKYDPLKQKDYYQLFAFFNNINGGALDGNAAAPAPVVRVGPPDTVARLQAVQKKVMAVRAAIDAEVARRRNDKSIDANDEASQERKDFVWIDDAVPAGARQVGAGGVNVDWTFVSKPAPVFHGEKSLKLVANGLQQVVIESAQPPLQPGKGDRLFAHVYLDPSRPPKEIMLQWHTDGWLHRAYWGENRIEWGKDKSPERFHVGPLPKAGEWVRLDVDAAKVGIKPGQAISGWAFTQFDGTAYWDRAGLTTQTGQGSQRFDTLAAWEKAQKAAGGGANLPKALQPILKIAPEKRTETQARQLRDYFIEAAWSKSRAVFEPLVKQLATAERERDAIEKGMPTSLVFKERAELRPSFILNRGEYDQRREQVGRDTPAFLPPLPKDAPRNRLGFAQWLVAPNHPLTARVAVNRFWQQVFGTGLVKTAEDFGAQGEPPSHPDLLDWLAVEFRESGWDVKALMKTIVMSATYRQSAKVTPEKLAKDPANRLFSRGPRFRLDAETLRDQALFISGLLVEKTGGPGVKPPQPAGLWEAVGYITSNTRNFTADTGHEKVHRRSLYTFWKRTAPPPQMSTVDAPSREACRVRRERTNTPLQALLLLNENQYVECARALAERVVKDGGTTPESRASFLFKRAAGRAPDAKELAELTGLVRELLVEYGRDSEAAKKLIAVGETKPDPALNPIELAAWTVVSNLVLNLDEVISK